MPLRHRRLIPRILVQSPSSSDSEPGSDYEHKRDGKIVREGRGPSFLYNADSTPNRDQDKKISIIDPEPQKPPDLRTSKELETRAAGRDNTDSHREGQSEPINISQDSSGHRSPDFCHISTNTTQDNTIHLELDIDEDYEEYLEDFSRLKRYGHFKDTEEYFQRNLQNQIRNPKIAVQYADMLLEQGATNHYFQLSRTGIFRLSEKPASVGDVSGLLNYKNFCLIHNRFLIDAKGHRRAALSMIETDRIILTDTLKEESEQKRDEISSIQLQIYRHWLYIMAQGVQGSSLVDPSVFRASWPEWNDLYNNLCSHERIWDFKDIFCAYLFASGADEAWINFSGGVSELVIALIVYSRIGLWKYVTSPVS